MTSIPEKGALCSAELISGLINGTLSHHGIKGMRWGVRRFQNKDGSLTPAGKKRYGSADVKAGSSPERSKPSLLRGKSGGGKKLSEMTDAELDARIRRMQKEKTYKELEASLTLNEKSRLKRVASDLLESLASKSGEALISRFVNSALKEKKLEKNSKLDLKIYEDGRTSFDDMSDAQIKSTLDRINNIRQIMRALDDYMNDETANNGKNKNNNNNNKKG